MSKRNRSNRRRNVSEQLVRNMNLENGSLKNLLKPLLVDSRDVLVAQGIDHCHGIEVFHQDGTISCSLEADCHGLETVHANGQSCGLTAVCEWCATK